MDLRERELELERRTEPPQPRQAHDRPSPTWAWVAQAGSGVLLLVLVTVHMVAQHFVVRGGLRGYADVVAWISNPVVFVIELAFLVTVTYHAMAGVHGILLDFGLRRRAERLAARVLAAVGVATVAYGTWLLATIARRG